MRVFLTGGSGFIGARVCRVLISAGHDVALLVRPNDSLSRIEHLLDRVELINGDLSQIEEWKSILYEWKPEACFHLAWYAEPGKYLDSPLNIPALTGSLVLLDYLCKLECRRIVMIGTCAEYDTDMGLLREDGPTKPTTIYAASKLSLSLVGQQLALRYNITFSWARIFYIYGPGEDERRVIPALIKSLENSLEFPATKGEQVRDYLHVDDVANALCLLMEKQATGAFNISSGVPITMYHLMEIVGDLVGNKDLIKYGEIPYRDWEPMFICGDNRRLRELGWKPKYDIKDGIKNYVNWLNS